MAVRRAALQRVGGQLVVKVYLLDNSMKTLLVAEDATAADVCAYMLEKIGLAGGSAGPLAACFSLHECTDGVTISKPLAASTPVASVAAKWPAGETARFVYQVRALWAGWGQATTDWADGTRRITAAHLEWEADGRRILRHCFRSSGSGCASGRAAGDSNDDRRVWRSLAMHRPLPVQPLTFTASRPAPASATCVRSQTKLFMESLKVRAGRRARHAGGQPTHPAAPSHSRPPPPSSPSPPDPRSLPRTRGWCT